jgi:hypothetical protein
MEFDMEEFDINMTIEEVSEPTYLELRYIILMFKKKKHQE